MLVLLLIDLMRVPGPQVNNQPEPEHQQTDDSQNA